MSGHQRRSRNTAQYFPVGIITSASRIMSPIPESGARWRGHRPIAVAVSNAAGRRPCEMATRYRRELSYDN